MESKEIEYKNGVPQRSEWMLKKERRWKRQRKIVKFFKQLPYFRYSSSTSKENLDSHTDNKRRYRLKDCFNRLVRFFYEKVSENRNTQWHHAAAYYDYSTRKTIMVIWPIHYVVNLYFRAISHRGLIKKN